MKRSWTWYSVFLHLAVLALVVEVLYLYQQNRDLRTLQNASRPPALSVGETVDPIAVRTLNGSPETLDPVGAERETVLLVFTTTCPFCVENQDTWKELYDRHRDTYDVVGLSIDSLDATRDYVDRHRLPFPVVVPDDPQAFPRDYRIPGVPQTLVVDREGRVRRTWPGVLAEDTLEQL